MAANPPDAFLSYTRFDDRHDRGNITEFCRRLASAVQAVTGVPFKIFQDVEGIGVGEHWRSKLDEMLSEARFLSQSSQPAILRARPAEKSWRLSSAPRPIAGATTSFCRFTALSAMLWRTRISGPPILWQARFTNVSRRTGASFASSRLRPGMSGERWSGWHGRSSKPTGARSRASAAAAGRGRHETRVPPRRARRVGRDTCRPSLALPGCGGGWARRRAPSCCPRCPRPSDVTEAPLARDPEDPVAGPWRARTILLVSLTCRPGPVVAVRSPSLRDAYCLN